MRLRFRQFRETARLLRNLVEFFLMSLWLSWLFDFLESRLDLDLSRSFNLDKLGTIVLNINGSWRLNRLHSDVFLWWFDPIDTLLVLITIALDHFYVQNRKSMLWLLAKIAFSLIVRIDWIYWIWILLCLRCRDIFTISHFRSFSWLITITLHWLVADVFFISPKGRLLLDPGVKHLLLVAHRIPRECHLWREWLAALTGVKVSQIESVIFAGIVLEPADHFL